MKHNLLFALTASMLMATPTKGKAQELIYPHHFNLSQVTLLDSPMKQAMDLNIHVLLDYDADRLLTPFIRQAGLTTGRYTNWLALHPNFQNWGGNGFDLSGHVGGHYLSALAMAYAACKDTPTRALLKTRLDYMLSILKDCQDVYQHDKTGMKGFLGGQPINEVWRELYQGNAKAFDPVRGWVPFYCEHKVMAGLRDTYLYTGNKTAKEMYRKMADWAVALISHLSAEQMQSILNTEQGGMNEVLADAYTIFGNKKYLEAAKAFSHQEMVDGMQTLNTTFLDNRHANTQVPKYIGFERIAEENSADKRYAMAAQNFWADVAKNRTTCIGGNSVEEHFLSKGNSNRYIDWPDGPESCNTNNMLKLSELLADRTHDARYADFYEYATLNHILSTQDPKTGGYVYFTTLRPQGYRIYSQVNQAMWCCVGTGMENHSKYGQFVYTHDADSVLYVNLFTPSHLADRRFDVTQTTSYPYSQQATLTINREGNFSLAIRHPWWTTADYRITVNGEPQAVKTTVGQASYVKLHRQWKAGDKVQVDLPMAMRVVPCPNLPDYVAFEYGPVLLAAKTTAENQLEADTTGLKTEILQNEYAGEGRMDHAPGAVGKSLPLTSAPMLIGERNQIFQRITKSAPAKLQFTLDVSRPDAKNYHWTKLTLQPFATIHHTRYSCYWYQQTANEYAHSDMAETERQADALARRTLDFVSPGEQQNEAGHEYNYSTDAHAGSFRDETYRDAQKGGYVQYSLFNTEAAADSLAILCRFTTADKGRQATLTVNGMPIAKIIIPEKAEGDRNGFFNVEYPLPVNLLRDKLGKATTKFLVRLSADGNTPNPGWYGLRLVRTNK